VIPEDGEYSTPLPAADAIRPRKERRRALAREWFSVHDLPRRLMWLVAVLTIGGVAGGVAGTIFGANRDWTGICALLALIAIGQVLAIETDDSSISVTAVGAIAGASLFGARIAFAAALVAHWSTGALAALRCISRSSTSALSPSRRSERSALSISLSSCRWARTTSG